MSIEGPEDLEGLRRAGAAVAAARDAMLDEVRAGISTAELDEVGRDVLRAHGARSAPMLAYDFPGWTCISVNADVAHGIPSATKLLRDGDLVNVDVSAELDGYWADTGASAPVGVVSARLRQLLWTTRAAQAEAMSEARAGRPIHVIGKAVERCAHRKRFSVIRNLGGHGVGRHIHENPHVSNVFDRRDKQPLWEGLVLTIEPFLDHACNRSDRSRRRLDAAHAGRQRGRAVRAHVRGDPGRADRADVRRAGVCAAELIREGV